jgi:hypothetical protein
MVVKNYRAPDLFWVPEGLEPLRTKEQASQDSSPD